MSAPKHTPGPWELQDGCSWRRIGTGGPGGRDGNVVRPFVAKDGHPDLVISPEDAALICAAPELLALLKELVDLEGPLPGNVEWARKVQAAIAKAEGR